MLVFSRLLVALVCLLAGCGAALQQASVSRNFQGHFGCPIASMQRVADGYHVQGCGRSAQYVCLSEPGESYQGSTKHGVGGIIAGALSAAAFSTHSERCVLASSERYASTAVAREMPATVARMRQRDGRELLKTRILFLGGNLRLLASPREHAEHALLIVTGVVRMQDAPCKSELFHDGVAVSIVQEAREGRYEARLVVPVAALADAQSSARFAGSVCGVEFDLNQASRTTLGLFAARFREERARIAHERAADAADSAKVALQPAPVPQVPLVAPAPAASPP